MITCSKCKQQNEEYCNFCNHCGSKLEKLCTGCAAPCLPKANFCGNCGHKLKNENAPAPEKGKRRQMTVLFCDLVGSTALSERLDLEDLREIIQSYQAICSIVVNRYGGHIAQFLGDGILVYFGFPKSFEDNAKRAVLTGLEIVNDMTLRKDQFQGLDLKVRIGIHSGIVVMGQMGNDDRKEQLAMGEVPNIAARLQGLAQPNTVIISGQTHQLLKNSFNCQSFGLQNLKGISQSVEILKVFKENENLNYQMTNRAKELTNH